MRFRRVALVAVGLLALSTARAGLADTARASSANRTTADARAPAVRATPAPWRLAAPVAREVAVADHGRLTIAGGLNAAQVSTEAVLRISPDTGTAAPLGSLVEAVHDAAGVADHGSILVFGGGGRSEGGTADVQAAGRSRPSTVIGSMPRPRSDLVAATVRGTTYVLGGYDGHEIVADVLSSRHGTSFASVDLLPVPVRYPAIAVVGTELYVFGGVMNSQTGTDTSAVQRLDTRTGAIGVVAHLPTSLSHASAIVLEHQVFLLGGYVDNTSLSDQILRFDPTTGRTTLVARLPGPISDAAAAVIGTTGYLLGGQGPDRTPSSTVTIISAD